MAPEKPRLDDLRIDHKPARKPASQINLALPALLIVILAVAWFWWRSRSSAVEVETALVRESTAQAGRTVLNASGYVTARRVATVSSKVTGKVIEVLIEEGMKVKEGQVLARLDDTNVKASLRLAEAQLESAKRALAETRVRIKEAEQDLRRQSDLVKNKIATQADFDHAEALVLALSAKLEQQQSDVTVADRQVASWQQQMEDSIIRAP